MPRTANGPSHYELLGVRREASADDIKRAWRALAAQHHPDRGGDEQVFQRLAEANLVLSSPERRRDYDTELDLLQAADRVSFAWQAPDPGKDDSSWGAAAADPNDPLWFYRADTRPGDGRHVPAAAPTQDRSDVVAVRVAAAVALLAAGLLRSTLAGPFATFAALTYTDPGFVLGTAAPAVAGLVVGPFLLRVASPGRWWLIGGAAATVLTLGVVPPAGAVAVAAAAAACAAAHNRFGG